MPASFGVNLRVTGHCSRGGRKYMEDFCSVAYQESAENEKDLEYAFIGIYDGHGGSEAAKFARKHLINLIVNQKLFWSDNDDDILRAIREGYIATHYAMWREQDKWPKTAAGLPSTAGTTASIAFIRRSKIYIGHAGDSGIVLGYTDDDDDEDAEDGDDNTDGNDEVLPRINNNTKNWRAMALTQEHKPECVIEKSRIINSGGKVVIKSGVPRVVWNRPRIGHKGPVRRSTPIDEIPFLAVARSLGDLWSYNSALNKFVVSPDPDVRVVKINPKKFRCLIFGTDGLWNVISANSAVEIVRYAEQMNEQNSGNGNGENRDWTNPSKCLVDKALEQWSTTRMRADNTSVVIIMIDPPGPPKREMQQNRTTVAPPIITGEIEPIIPILSSSSSSSSDLHELNSMTSELTNSNAASVFPEFMLRNNDDGNNLNVNNHTDHYHHGIGVNVPLPSFANNCDTFENNDNASAAATTIPNKTNFTIYDHSTKEIMNLESTPMPTSGLAIMTKSTLPSYSTLSSVTHSKLSSTTTLNSLDEYSSSSYTNTNCDYQNEFNNPLIVTDRLEISSELNQHPAAPYLYDHIHNIYPHELNDHQTTTTTTTTTIPTSNATTATAAVIPITNSANDLDHHSDTYSLTRLETRTEQYCSTFIESSTKNTLFVQPQNHEFNIENSLDLQQQYDAISSSFLSQSCGIIDNNQLDDSVQTCLYNNAAAVSAGTSYTAELGTTSSVAVINMAGVNLPIQQNNNGDTNLNHELININGSTEEIALKLISKSINGEVENTNIVEGVNNDDDDAGDNDNTEINNFNSSNENVTIAVESCEQTNYIDTAITTEIIDDVSVALTNLLPTVSNNSICSDKNDATIQIHEISSSSKENELINKTIQENRTLADTLNGSSKLKETPNLRSKTLQQKQMFIRNTRSSKQQPQQITTINQSSIQINKNRRSLKKNHNFNHRVSRNSIINNKQNENYVNLLSTKRSYTGQSSKQQQPQQQPQKPQHHLPKESSSNRQQAQDSCRNFDLTKRTLRSKNLHQTVTNQSRFISSQKSNKINQSVQINHNGIRVCVGVNVGTSAAGRNNNLNQSIVPTTTTTAKPKRKLKPTNLSKLSTASSISKSIPSSSGKLLNQEKSIRRTMKPTIFSMVSSTKYLNDNSNNKNSNNNEIKSKILITPAAASSSSSKLSVITTRRRFHKRLS